VEAANHAIDFLKAADRGLDALDFAALQAAQDRHDAVGALALAQKALFGAY
jgi:xylose isomerase